MGPAARTPRPPASPASSTSNRTEPAAAHIVAGPELGELEGLAHIPGCRNAGERGGEVTRTTHKLSGRRPSAGQPTAEPPSHHYDSEFSPEKSFVPSLRFFPFGSAWRENNSHEPSFKWFLLEPQRFGSADSHCECQARDAPGWRSAERSPARLLAWVKVKAKRRSAGVRRMPGAAG